MSNGKELVLFCRKDGKWAVYDDTYDITIHCESQQEQDKTMELLRKANKDACEVMSPEDMAHYLMDFCHDHLAAGKGCQGCPFNRPSTKEGGGACRLCVPSDWDI